MTTYTVLHDTGYGVDEVCEGGLTLTEANRLKRYYADGDGDDEDDYEVVPENDRFQSIGLHPHDTPADYGDY